MILGWSEGFHDAAAAVIDYDGNILFASHSERFSGKKHEKFISPELKEYIDCNFDITRKTFYERPFIKKTRQLYAGQYSHVFSKRQMCWKPDSVWPHHLSHAAAAFQTSEYDNAVAVVVDAIGEWDCTSIWSCDYLPNGKVRYIKEWSMTYPNSIGLWYTALTAFVGLRPLDEEYIFMGMAAYGKTHDKFLRDVLNELLEGNHNLHKGVPARFKKDLDGYKSEDIAAVAQEIIEVKLIKVFTKAKEYGSNFVYGGGVALNCVANSKLAKFVDNKLWIMPNPGDAGGALGAACLEYGRRVKWKGPYLGYFISPTKSKRMLVNDIVNHLEQEGMCGIAWGEAEYGPRALGNRTLCADPRGPKVKDLVNTVKRRQKFRPFAPAVLEEYAAEYFEGADTLSPYMQQVYNCLKPNELPAIVHQDGTSRVQTVGKKDKTILRAVLEEWYKRTGCPVLLNTSLNIRGEPMVNDRGTADRFEQLYNVKVFY